MLAVFAGFPDLWPVQCAQHKTDVEQLFAAVVVQGDEFIRIQDIGFIPTKVRNPLQEFLLAIE